MRGLVAIVLPLLAGCADLLGYDEVQFHDGGSAHGSSGGAANGGTAAGGAAGVGGTSSGGAPQGGGGVAGVPGGGAPNGGGAPGGGGASNGGGAPSGGGAPGGGGATGDKYDAHRQKCVDQINAYRATIGLTPYVRWTSAESCVDAEVKKDSETGVAHSAFGACGEWAQNECPGYPGLDSTVTTCLAQMWAEGPGADFQTHGHYINMSSTQYTKVACGFYESPNGVWAAQDFQ